MFYCLVFYPVFVALVSIMTSNRCENFELIIGLLFIHNLFDLTLVTVDNLDQYRVFIC